ncbi:MAG: DUF692 family multinuclear iron-containing protein [Nitrospiria bacterium]
MNSLREISLNRIDALSLHGVGLSVDLHMPDLFELVLRLNQSSLSFDYLEIFRAPQSHLKSVRQHFLNKFPLEYHADCLWYTQPDFPKTPWKKECDKIIRDSATLHCEWITHECATKQIAGYPFGTYIPPLLTKESGELIGRQSEEIQNYLFTHWTESEQKAPFLILEVPPFYSFAVGDLSLSSFFNSIANYTPCGFLLDIGHVYTYYLSTRMRELVAFPDFYQTFLDEFPLDRVVQVHLGGLKPFHHTYFDDHGGRIPKILFDLLKNTLDHPKLKRLKGVALEVDTKEIDLIVEEYAHFQSIAFEWKEAQKVIR